MQSYRYINPWHPMAKCSCQTTNVHSRPIICLELAILLKRSTNNPIVGVSGSLIFLLYLFLLIFLLYLAILPNTFNCFLLIFLFLFFLRANLWSLDHWPWMAQFDLWCKHLPCWSVSKFWCPLDQSVTFDLYGENCSPTYKRLTRATPQESQIWPLVDIWPLGLRCDLWPRMSQFDLWCQNLPCWSASPFLMTTWPVSDPLDKNCFPTPLEGSLDQYVTFWPLWLKLFPYTPGVRFDLWLTFDLWLVKWSSETPFLSKL